MTQLQFEAIGTEWTILLDHEVTLSEEVQLLTELEEFCHDFDRKYSRFRTDSWLSQIRCHEGEERQVQLDPEAVQLFQLGLQCEAFTQGRFSLNVAKELEQLGYDTQYSLDPKNEKLQPRGRYWLNDNTLHIQGRVCFDLGSFGKGFLIDKLAKRLQLHGFTFFLVDGSGDFYGTEKGDGSPWVIGLEHPEQSNEAIGTIGLHNQGFASSSVARRRWKKKHHILDARSGKPIQQRVALFVAAPTATFADALTTALFVSPPSLWSSFEELTPHSWCTLEMKENQLRFEHSANFEGNLFRH